MKIATKTLFSGKDLAYAAFLRKLHNIMHKARGWAESCACHGFIRSSAESWLQSTLAHDCETVLPLEPDDHKMLDGNGYTCPCCGFRSLGVSSDKFHKFLKHLLAVTEVTLMDDFAGLACKQMGVIPDEFRKIICYIDVPFVTCFRYW